MATTFTGLRVQDTYNAIIKIGDNSTLTGTGKLLSDGYGNSSNLYLSTTSLGIGVVPTENLHISGSMRLTGSFKDKNNEAGTTGQVLTSTATGTDWKTISDIDGVTSATGGTAYYVPIFTSARNIENSIIQASATLVTISGNLDVNGTVTYIDTIDLSVKDPLIKLANANVSNTLDIGFYGKYIVSATTKYLGLYSDASDSNKFKLFTGVQTEPTTVVDATATGYAIGTLVASLEGNVIGNVTGDVSGNSGTVTNGVYTIGNQTIAGIKTFSSSIVSNLTGNVTGNADTSTKILSITNSNIVQLTTAQTLTNKTLTSPTITGTGAIAGTFTGNLTGNVSGNLSGNVTGGTISGTTGTFSGDVTANHYFADTHFRSTDIYSVLSTTGVGTVFLRPEGYNVVTNSATLSGGTLTLNGVNPEIAFNGSSDVGVDMAIKATPEGLDFYEPEDGNKIHFQILDDIGVNAVYGYKLNGTMVIDASRNLTNIGTGGFSGTVTAPTFAGNITGGTISGTTGSFSGLVTGIAPSVDLNFATKKYVDDSIPVIPATPALSAVLAAGNTSGAYNIQMADSQKLLFGATDDLEISESFGNSYMINNTGDLYIENLADDKDIVFINDDGLGGSAVYFFMDGSEQRNKFFKNVQLLDNKILEIGSSQDLQIYHNGTDSYITNSTGNLNISGATNFTDNIQVGATTKTTDTIVKALSADTVVSGFEAHGNAQGTGYFYAGQSGTHGGGMFYNGDGTPAFAAGETDDAISFYRRAAGVNTVVFDFMYNNDTVRFKGGVTITYDLTVSGGDIILGGTGRIQGIDTVSATTDAANKAYVDAHPDGTVKGTGTATQVAFWSASDTLSSNSLLYWDNTNNRLGIGATPSGKLDVTYAGTGGTGILGIGEGINITSLSPNITFNDSSASVDNYAIHLNQSVFTLGRYTSSTAMSSDLVLTSGNATFGGNVSVLSGKVFKMYNAANNGWAQMKFNETDNIIEINRGIKNSGADWLLSENSINSFVCANQGNFGIGITLPDVLLHIKAPDTVTGVIKIEGGKNTVTSAGEINSQLDFGSNDGSVNNTGNVGGRISSVTENTNGAVVGMAFSTFQQSRTVDLQEAMRITNAGYVGIGTSSPGYPLTVESGGVGTVLRAGTAFVSIDSVGSAASPSLIFNGDANTGIWRPASDTLGFSTAGVTRLTIDSSGNSTFAGNVSTGNLTATNTTSGWTAYINNNVGSGTQSGLLLDAGSSSADFAMYVRNAAGSSDFFAIKGNGNVGIGTDSPDSILDIVGNNPILTIRDVDTSTTTASATLRFAESGAGGTLDRYWDVGLTPVANFVIGSDGTERLTIDSSGNSTFTGNVTTNGEIKIVDSSATGNPKLSFYQTTNQRAYIQYADTGEKLIIDSDSSLVLNTNNLPRLTIDSNGNSTFTGTINSGAITSTASIIASGNSNSFGNTTTAALTATSGTFSSSVTASGNSNSFGNTSTGALSATTVGVTNIVTNFIPKFNGTIFDDSLLKDDGTLTYNGNQILSTKEFNDYEGSQIGSDTLFEILESDDTTTLQNKLNYVNAALTRVQDSTAPAGGCFELNNKYASIALPQWHKVEAGQEYTFEIWAKWISGTDVAQSIYTGSSFYDANKTYLGNTQRYWGESGLAVDGDTRNDGWYFISGTLGPDVGTSVGNIPTSAKWMKLIMLLNYPDNANIIRFCGLRYYKSGGVGAKMVTSIYRKAIGSEAGSSAGAWLGNQVMDTAGNLYGAQGTFTADVSSEGWYKGASNTNTLYSSTSLGTYIQTPTNTGTGTIISFRNSIGTVSQTFNTSTGAATFTGNVTVGTGIINPSIGGDIAITQGAVGLRLNDAASAISPTTATANNDNAIDLGVSNIRFKDLYLGGSITAGAATFAGNVIIDGFTSNKYLSLRNSFDPSSSGGIGLKAIDHSGSSSDGLALYGHDGISFYTAQAERMRINSSGNATFTGSITAVDNIYLNGVAPVLYVSSSNANSGFRINVTGLDAAGDTLMRFQDNGTTVFTVRKDGVTTLIGSLVGTNADLNGNCKPTITQTHDLGSAALAWDYTYSRYFQSTGTSARVKLSVWSGMSYGFGMQSPYTFGGLGGYAITCNMSNHNERGFWWGDSSHSNAQGAFACTTQGKFTIAHSLRLGYGESDTTAPGATYTLDVSGKIRASDDIIAYSDARIKDNVKTIDNALEKVTKLRGVSYNRNDIDDKSNKIGVIAQEVKEVFPELVSEDGLGMNSVAYGNMAGVFIEAIKELKAEIDELKNKSCNCKCK